MIAQLLHFWPEILFAAMSVASILLVGRKWEMAIRQFGRWAVLSTIFGIVFITLLRFIAPSWYGIVYVGMALASVYALSVALILYYFFRDPEREPPTDEDVLLSPADGRVIYIKEVDGGAFPFALKKGVTIPLEEFSKVELIPDRGIQIGIAMNFLDVHVNRSPIAGTVSMVERIPGAFKSLKHLQSLLENERVLMTVEGKSIRIGMVQIASRLVRKIVPYVTAGQAIDAGDRVGMIRFGSQVDLLIPTVEGIDILVKEKDEVVAGETIIGRLCLDEV